MRQWHPLFAQLLRPLLEKYFDIQTGFSVGDAPREADIVVLQRTSVVALPFQGVWRWLTPWNVLEFKGPTVSPRVDDLDLLLELGWGVHRRLNEEQAKQGLALRGREEVSLWYLAPRLGRRFLRAMRQLLGQELTPLAPGVWRARLVERWVLFVSRRDLPVDRDSVPLHLLTPEPDAASRAVVDVVTQHPDLWELYGEMLLALHPQLTEEVRRMARARTRGPQFDVEPLVDWIGMPQLIERLGLKRMIDAVGLKQVIGEVGLKQVIGEVGHQPFMDALFAELSPKERKEFLRRLQE